MSSTYEYEQQNNRLLLYTMFFIFSSSQAITRCWPCSPCVASPVRPSCSTSTTASCSSLKPSCPDSCQVQTQTHTASESPTGAQSGGGSVTTKVVTPLPCALWMEASSYRSSSSFTSFMDDTCIRHSDTKAQFTDHIHIGPVYLLD